MPFGFHLAMDTLPSGELQVLGFRSALACVRLSLSCPFKLLHTFHLPRPTRHYPRLRIQRSSFERRRDFNPPEQRAAQRTLRTLRRPPNQTWRTFLHNHIGQMVSTDFFTVPTITMKVLFVFVVLEHDRRKVLHFNVTEHPTAPWTAQQIVEAFADRDTARYLLRDRDGRYNAEIRLRIQSLGMQEILTAPQSPWQNPYAERLIGSIRRECLNHYVILNARHLKRTLSYYFRYYHDREPA